MKQILADYLEICLKFRKEYLSKPERKQRHILLTGWAKAQYAEANPTILELYEFWDKYKDVSYNKIFIDKVIVPTVDEDFQNGGIEGLKFLFHCLHGKDRIEYISSSNPVSIFSNGHNYKYSAFQLADTVLENDPDNEDALKVKYFLWKEILWYSIHEIPDGVLNGMNGADISDIPNMLNSVDRFQSISNKLKIDNDKTLIEDCRKFYVAYREYLQQVDKYVDFEDYLNKNSISYTRCCAYYFNEDNIDNHQ
ncbi:MAG: hypothetical protein K1W31_17855 [Lachnospiraceae bacterium]